MNSGSLGPKSGGTPSNSDPYTYTHNLRFDGMNSGSLGPKSGGTPSNSDPFLEDTLGPKIYAALNMEVYT